MENKAETRKKVIEEFNEKFYQPDYINSFQSFFDLIWQIMINDVYEGKKMCFWIDVMDEKNNLIVADENGGYIKTEIKFIDDNYNNCVELIEKLNTMVFGLSVEAADKLISTSMLNHDLLT